MLKFLGNLFWRDLVNKETSGVGSVRSQYGIDDGVAAFRGTDWSSGFVGYVLDNNSLWYSERHSAQELQ